MSREAILFPGQGLAPEEIIDFHNRLKALDSKTTGRFMTEAQLALNQIHGSSRFNILSSLQDPTSPDFKSTAFIQPVIYGLSIAAFRIKQDEVDPVAVAGHSLGEYAALEAAGAFPEGNGMKIVAYRGKFMQDACEENPSRLISFIGADQEAIEEICSYGIAEIALVNAPGLVVLGCAEEVVPKVEELAKKHGVRKTVVLQTAGAFHTKFMEKAAERLKYILQGYSFNEIQLPVVANFNGRAVKEGRFPLEHLISGMTHPVQWAATIAALSRKVEGFVEVGPGSSLQSLNRLNKIPKENSRNILD